MTEPSGGTTYSKDYWDIVLGQLRHRPSVKLSLVILVLLYAAAIYAPFLANDRPLVFTGTDRSSYRQAQREVGFVAEGLLAKARAGEGAFLAFQQEERRRGETLEGGAKETWQEQQAQAPATFAAYLGSEREALALRIRAMRRQLDPEHKALLDALASAADRVVAAAEQDDGPALEAAGADLTAAAGRVRAELKPVRPGEEPEPGHTVALQPFTSYPVLERLTGGEVYFMVLWLAILLWPLWNRGVNRLLLGGDRARIRRARRPKFLRVALLPVIPAVIWWAGYEQPEGAALVSGFKQGLSGDGMTAEEVVFPPVPFGMAEQNMTETFRPPTWAPEAEIDQEGYYVRGARAIRVDPQTGMTIPPEQVEVRYGEPPLNAPTRRGLGTDSLGRDLVSRLIWGGRVSLSVGLVSTVVLVLLGTLLGALAGFFGGWVDTVISRIIEIFQCFPVFFLILIVVSFLGPSILNIMLAIGLFRWTGVARLVRGEFIRLRGEDFVVASRALGVGNLRTIFRHVLPNAMGPVLVAATFAVASGILTESALSFLGFGVQLPIPSWGSLLIESSSPEQWWIQIFPGALIFITVMLYNLLGEGVRDALDPRLKEA